MSAENKLVSGFTKLAKLQNQDHLSDFEFLRRPEFKFVLDTLNGFMERHGDQHSADASQTKLTNWTRAQTILALMRENYGCESLLTPVFCSVPTTSSFEESAAKGKLSMAQYHAAEDQALAYLSDTYGRMVDLREQKREGQGLKRTNEPVTEDGFRELPNYSIGIGSDGPFKKWEVKPNLFLQEIGPYTRFRKRLRQNAFVDASGSGAAAR